MSEDLEAVFKKGVEARANSTPLSENPYPIRSVEHREWTAGWTATCDLDEDDDPQSTRVKAGDTDKDEKPPRNRGTPIKDPISD